MRCERKTAFRCCLPGVLPERGKGIGGGRGGEAMDHRGDGRGEEKREEDENETSAVGEEEEEEEEEQHAPTAVVVIVAAVETPATTAGSLSCFRTGASSSASLLS